MFWTASFQGQICDPILSSESDNLFTANLIQNSKLKVILLCGLEAQSGLVKDLLLGKPETIQLRGHDIKIWIKSIIIEKQQFHRAFIAAPALHKLRGSHWQAVQKFIEVFRLTKLLTGVSLDCTLPERAQVYARIFQQARLERDYPDTPLWEVDTLNPLIRSWLFNRGFENDADIEKLAKLAGSLATGLCMLTHFLPCGHTGSSRTA
jgi:hypothetical protein